MCVKFALVIHSHIKALLALRRKRTTGKLEIAMRLRRETSLWIKQIDPMK